MTHTLTVSDVMTPDVIVVTGDTPYKTLVAMLAEHHISALPVINQYGGVGGVVSETDLLRKEEFQRSRSLPWALSWWRHRARSKAAGRTAADVMTHPAVTIAQDATIPAAARLMARRGITRLIVTDSGGDVLTGIVTRSDLLKVFLVPDDSIRQQVRRDVVEHAIWADPIALEIGVEDGGVTLTGRLEHRSMTESAEKLTRGIDGVVDVVNELTWAFDDTAPPSGTPRRN